MRKNDRFPLKELKQLHPKGYITPGKKFATDYSSKHYVVATEEEGLYFYLAQQKSVKLLAHYKWDQVPAELYISNRKENRTYRTKKKNLVLTIFVGDEEGKIVAELIERRRKIAFFLMPWYRKIPGYRSQSVWKMILASFVYFFFFLTAAAAFSDDDPATEKAKVEQLNTLKASETKEAAEAKKEKEKARLAKLAAEKEAAQKEAERAKAQATKAAEEKKKSEALALAKKKAEEEKRVAAEKAKKEAERRASIAAAKREAEKKAVAEKEAAEAAEAAAAAATVQTGFNNCTELRTVYPNGVASTHPAYQPKMDRDKDNFACERY